jgi:hypothetical protein
MMVRLTLRARLYLAVLGALLPMALVAAAAALMLVEDERRAIEREALGRARAAMSAVDAHLAASIDALKTLAASPELEAGDIRAFHAESQRVLRTQPAWANVGLATPAPTTLSNAIYAFTKPEPLAPADEPSFVAALRDGRPAVGSVARGTAVRNPTARLRVPVVYNAEVRYVLSAPLNLKYLAELLRAQQLPSDWAIGLIDRQRQIVARIPPVAAGLPVSDAMREALGRAPEGWFPSRTQEGAPSYTAYVTSPMSGWVLAIAVPARAVEGESRRALALVAAGIAAALAAGLLIAWLAARKMPQ